MAGNEYTANLEKLLPHYVAQAGPMLEESKQSYTELFSSLKERGLKTPSLIVPDAPKGLVVTALRECFTGSSWQRCKVHFMRNILAPIPHREKNCLAAEPKQTGTGQPVRMQDNGPFCWRKNTTSVSRMQFMF